MLSAHYWAPQPGPDQISALTPTDVPTQDACNRAPARSGRGAVYRTWRPDAPHLGADFTTTRTR